MAPVAYASGLHYSAACPALPSCVLLGPALVPHCLPLSPNPNSVSILALVLIAVTWQATSERMQIHAGLPLFLSLSSSPYLPLPLAFPFAAILPLDDSIATRKQPSQKLTHCSHRLQLQLSLSPSASPSPSLLSLHCCLHFPHTFSQRFSFTALSYAIFTKCLPRRCVSCCAFFRSLPTTTTTTPRDICSTLNGHLSVTPRPPRPPTTPYTL